MTAAWVLIAAGVALALAAWNALFRDTGRHAAPPARYRVWDDRTIPARATRRQPPWPTVGPHRTWQPQPLCAHRGALLAALTYTRGLALEAERLATSPWEYPTGAFARITDDMLAGAR